jgi:serine/threonine-protein kinase
MPTPTLLQRLKERKLVQWALAYLAGAWVIYEVTATVGSSWGLTDIFLQGLFVVLAFGFFITLVLAWYHGEKGRQRVGGVELILVAGLLVVAGLVVSALPDRERASEPDETGGASLSEGSHPSIAVLVCENLSRDPDDAYLAAGIHDEILLRLTRVSGLVSLGRASVAPYTGEVTPLSEIVSDLGVDFVGQCSVRRDDERIRVTFQLMDGRGVQIWGRSFDHDRSPGSFFQVHNEIAQSVAAGIGAQLEPSERTLLDARPTEVEDAYQFYLRGWDYWIRPGSDLETAQNLSIAEDLWARAIELDPHFALARSRLSFLHGRTYFRGFDISAERLAHQLEEAQEAVRLDPDLPEARFAQGYVHYVKGELRKAIEEFRLAEKKAPNDPQIPFYLGAAYRRLGDWDSWEGAYRRSVLLNPRNLLAYFELGARTFFTLRRYDEAIAALDRALELAPDYSAASVRRGVYLARIAGDTEPVWAVLDSLPPDVQLDYRMTFSHWDRDLDRASQSLAHHPDVDIGQHTVVPRSLEAAWTYRIAGDERAAALAFDSARSALDSLQRVDPADYRIHAAFGFVYAGLGRSLEAVESARRYIESRPYPAEDLFFHRMLGIREAKILAQARAEDEALERIEWLLSGPSELTVGMLKADPIWDPLRDHPRFQALLEKHGDHVEH